MKTFLMLVLCAFLAFPGTAQITDTATTSRTPLSRSEFNRLYQNVRGQSSDSLKVETLKETFINTNYLSTAQIRKLLSLIPRDSDKLALARSAYYRVTDSDNFLRLTKLFDSSVYKREFVNWVNEADKDGHDIGTQE